MVDHNSDRYSEGQSDHSDMTGMGEPTLVDFWKIMLNENYSGIRYQSIDANNFELKQTLISLVQQQQFVGHPLDDPNAHLAIFLELCGTITMNELDHNVIKLKLFPSSLKDKAIGWFHKFSIGFIDIWG